jgi:hypothetical protein
LKLQALLEQSPLPEVERLPDGSLRLPFPLWEAMTLDQQDGWKKSVRELGYSVKIGTKGVRAVPPYPASDWESEDE